jgi:hypothetical protein
MLSRVVQSSVTRVSPMKVQSRNIYKIGNFWQQAVWRKSTVMYISWVVAGCIVGEIVYGKLTNYLWESNNRGVSIFLSSTELCFIFPFLAEIISSHRLDSIQI